jgi:hypothetical protein
MCAKVAYTQDGSNPVAVILSIFPVKAPVETVKAPGFPDPAGRLLSYRYYFLGLWFLLKRSYNFETGLGVFFRSQFPALFLNS